jgi:plastocyanin
VQTVATFLALFLCCAAAQAEEKGSIHGTLRIVGLPVGSQNAGPQEAIVFVEDAPGPEPVPPGPFEIAQEAKAFRPRVLVVPVGAFVSFPNRDLVSHNVFSISRPNHFDLGLFKPGSTNTVRFENPGIVSVYCNIHPQMLGYVIVTPSRFHARPEKNGSFQLAGLPPGTFHLVGWYPFGKPVRQEVHVPAEGAVSVEVVLYERGDARRHNRKDGKPYVSYSSSE